MCCARQWDCEKKKMRKEEKEEKAKKVKIGRPRGRPAAVDCGRAGVWLIPACCFRAAWLFVAPFARSRSSLLGALMSLLCWFVRGVLLCSLHVRIAAVFRIRLRSISVGPLIAGECLFVCCSAACRCSSLEDMLGLRSLLISARLE